LEKVKEVLKNHPVNLARVRKGFLPANYLLVRGAGTETPKLKKYNRWMAVTYFPLERGFAKVSQMKVFSFDYPKQKSIDSYENIREGLKEACKFSIKSLTQNYKNSDYAYVHISEIDFPSHDNHPIEKKNMLEFIDENLIKFLKDFVIQNGIKLVVTSNYTSACKSKTHSAEPVPVLFFNPSVDIMPTPKKFSEKGCVGGELGEFLGKELFKKVGFLK
jgi:2,3-bisphosphoglycerate-independent phosphoglycerate mutase